MAWPNRRRRSATRMNAAGDVMVEALRTALENQPLTTGKVRLAWSRAVGGAIARLTTVTLKTDRTVAVTAPDSRWARELGQSRPLIIRRMNDILGTGVVKRLEIGSTPGPGERRSRS